MRPFHPIGLPGLRVPAAGDPWPLVLPGDLARKHQEVAIAVYQAAAADKLMSRVEVEWRGQLVRADRRYLGHLRDRGGAAEVVVVVWMREGATEVREVLAEETLAPFPHLVVVNAAPGGGEPLGPLREMCGAVYQRLEELYDDLVTPLSLQAPDLSLLDPWWRDFLSPLDLVELVNHFVAVQLERLSPEEAALKARSLRVWDRLQTEDELLTILQLAGKEAGQPDERRVESLRRRGLVVGDDDALDLQGWPAQLSDDALWAEAVPRRPAAAARGRAEHWGWEARRKVRDGQLDAAEEILRQHAADPVTMEPGASLDSEDRGQFLDALAALQAARGDYEAGFAARRRAAEESGSGWRWSDLAMEYFKHDRLEEAVSASERAVAIRGSEGLSTHAFFLGRVGRLEEAVAALGRLTSLRASDRERLTRWLRALGRHEEAAKALRELIEQERLEGQSRRRRARTWRHLADSLRHLGRDEEAAHADEAATALEGGREP